jgi:ubiquitin carboxyl-terminal hydrolase 5/13
MRRFVYEDWVPRKLAVQLEVPDTLDLSKARASTDRGTELQLPDNNQKQDAAPKVNAEFVQALVEMGFPKVRAERAVFSTNNAGAEAAMAWLLDHMEDADIDKPLPKPASESAQKPVNEEAVKQLQDMGFTAAQARKALRETENSMDRAVEWLFCHADDPGSDEPPQKKESVAVAEVDMLPPHYELIGFVVHLGPSVHTGHYVAFIKKDGQWVQFNDRKVAESAKPPSGQAYMYFFRRIKS